LFKDLTKLSENIEQLKKLYRSNKEKFGTSNAKKKIAIDNTSDKKIKIDNANDKKIVTRLVALIQKCHVQMPRLESKKNRRIESLKVV